MARRDSEYYHDSYFYEPSRPREAEGGIKARNQRGEFARNWWATRWIEAMERLVDKARLGRGRSYARRGQILSIEETKDGIKARVQGSRPTPYRIIIRITPLSDGQWEKVIDVLSGQALFAAQLLAGEMPADIEEAFASAGVSLFPSTQDELVTECSCPDWANPCKHVAATHYILGERFDEDPFLLFRLRGRDQPQILEALRRRRADQDSAEVAEEAETYEAVVPLQDTIPRFWDMSETLKSFPVCIEPPRIALPILKRLGEPAFMGEIDLQSQLTSAYEAITTAALALAFRNEDALDDG